MAEVSRSREEHGDFVLVAGGNGVGIVLGTAGLNDGGHSRLRGLIDRCLTMAAGFTKESEVVALDALIVSVVSCHGFDLPA